MKGGGVEVVVYIGYVRVSRSEEKPENQVQAIKRFIGEGKEVKIFMDVGVSGVIPAKKRKGFKEMLAYIHQIRKERGEEEEIRLYVYEISRLGRDMLDTVTMIKKLEEELSVKVYSVSEKEQFLNTQEESIRKLILSFFAWNAEREVELTKQRICEGMRRARMEGKVIGRPKVVLTERQIKDVKKYMKLGLNLSAISKLIGVKYHVLRERLMELGLYEVKKGRRKKEESKDRGKE